MRLFFCALLAGCFAPKPPTGALSCGDRDSCPDGYSCIGGRCWTSGTGPDMAVALDDMSMPEDLSGSDLAGLDFSANADLTSRDLGSADIACAPPIGTWQVTACVPAPNGLFERDFVEVNGSALLYDNVYYNANDCATPLFLISTLSTLSVTAQPGGPCAMDTTVQSVSALALDTTLKNSWNSMPFCGFTDWAVGLPKTVTGLGCGSFLAAGFTVANIYALDPGGLRFGSNPGVDAGTTRPTVLGSPAPATCSLGGNLGCFVSKNCSLHSAYPQCTTPGGNALGSGCSFPADDCAAGADCILGTDGGATPEPTQCRQFCRDDNDCTQAPLAATPTIKSRCAPAGLAFFTQPFSLAKLCTINCDPINQLGCPPGTNCVVSSFGGSQFTDCAPIGSVGAGASCGTTGPYCASGLTCESNNKCRKPCLGPGNCGSDQCVLSGVDPYGSCCPGGSC